ncbi:hypothetical protein V1264_017588 [Littorina saxatilis]|uniref:Laminin G domain-containing protein n=1 Tax=Littorina saxatilis TaxID=31220 RepID=A0AAN9GFC6_9CAEN
MFPQIPYMLTTAFLQAGVAQASLPVPVIYIYGENSSSVRIAWLSPTPTPSTSSSPFPTEYRVQKLDVPFATHVLTYSDGSRLTGTGYYRVRPLPAWWRPYIGLRVKATIRSQNGVLAFMSSSDQRQYFAIILVEGIPRLTYANNDGCVADVFINVERTENRNLSKLSDGKEHTVMALWEDGNMGSLRVDQTYFAKMIESNSKCKRGSTLQLDTDLYLGGVPRSFSVHSRVDPWLNRAAGIELAGCVHSVEILEQKEAPEMWRGVGWNCSATLAVGLPPPSPRSCPSNLREGIHFMGDGYAVIPNCQTPCGLQTAIGNIQLSFTMRTTHNAGALLFLIHGPKKHYLVGYLIPTGLAMSMWFLMYRDGRIPWQVNSCSLKNIRLCDGQWHNITVRKTNSALYLAVDNTPWAVSGYKPVGYLNLTSPIYLGGVKQSPELLAFLTSSVWPSSNAPNVTKGFSGCIKDVQINGAMVDLTSATQARNVKLDGCPPEGQGQGQGDKKRGCSSRTPVQTLYRGNNTPLDDLASLPNTDYLYRVLQDNAAGPWVYSRTEMTTSASCPARGPLLQDGYLSCGNTPWENGTKVTHQFRVKRDTFPALCPVSPTNREVRFERAPNRTGPYQRRCTVQDLTKACTGAFKPGTLGCGCIEISGSSFLVEYTFVARPEDSGWWRGSLDCYDADLASPLLSFGSNDNCHDRRVVLPGSSDTSSDGGSGGSGYGSVGLGNDTGK